MKNFVIYSFLMLAVLGLISCGQTGKLYLPEKTTPTTTG